MDSKTKYERKKALGITIDKNGNEVFNENVFAKYVFEKNKIIQINKNYHIYSNEDKCWNKSSDNEMRKKMYKYFEDVEPNLWKVKFENKYKPVIEILADEEATLNKYPYKINFNDGVYNFQTRTIEKSDSKNLFSYKNNYEISSGEINSPVFDKLINDITLEREELKEYILDLLSYLISGTRKLQNFFIFYGGGANGKSTLLNLISQIIGEQFVTSISLSKIDSQFALGSVVGKKVIIASENESKRSLSTETIKNLTGGDLVQVEKKYQDSYTTRLNVETIFASNNPINFADNSIGFKRRIRVIPFEFRVTEDNKDPEIESKLQKEIPDIMRKLIKRFESFAEKGYKLPKCSIIEEATENFLAEGKRMEMGRGVFDFFQEELLINPEMRTTKNEIYEKFLSINEMPSSSTKFWLDFKKWTDFRNIEVKEVRNGLRYLCGIGLKDKNVSDGNEDSFDDIFEE